jgi:hypothetical protein
MPQNLFTGELELNSWKAITQLTYLATVFMKSNEGKESS